MFQAVNRERQQFLSTMDPQELPNRPGKVAPKYQQEDECAPQEQIIDQGTAVRRD